MSIYRYKFTCSMANCIPDKIETIHMTNISLFDFNLMHKN